MNTKTLNFIFTCILFHVLSVGYSQDTLITYFDSDWEKIDSKEGAEFFRKSFAANGKRAFYDYYINGKIQSTGSYQTEKEEVEDGTFTYYSEEGVKTKIVEYRNGDKNGLYRSFYDDKRVKLEGNYVDSKKDCVWKWYHKNGQPCSVETYENDEMQSAVYLNESGNEMEYTEPVTRPTYGGSDEALLAYIEENFSYPAEAREHNIEGTVVLKFLVDEEGFTSNHEVERSVHEWLDNEALRILSTMKQWTPGKAHNQSAKFEYRLPINFNLTD